MKRAWKLRCFRVCIYVRMCVRVQYVWTWCRCGPFEQPRRLFYTSGKKKKKSRGGDWGEIYSHASYSKSCWPASLKFKKKLHFCFTLSFFHIELVLLLQHNRPEACMWAAFGGLMRKVLQSQVFVSISAGINRLSRQRSRPSAITGPEAESSTCSSVFTKWTNCSFIFLFFLKKKERNVFWNLSPKAANLKDMEKSSSNA